MARRSRNHTTEEERDDPLIANLLAPIAPAPLLSPSYSPSHDLLTEIEDRRSFHPDAFFRSALDTEGRNVNPKARHKPGPFSRIDFPAFDTPSRQVAVCIRRKTRREVIFAKKKRGKGARARRRRRNYYSNIRC